MENLAIVVTSCDAYTDDCAKPFLTLLDRYWQNHPKAYWIAETKTPAGFAAATSNEPIWTKRVRQALQAVKEDFVLFLCDDHFIRNTVAERRIEYCTELLNSYPNIACFNSELQYRHVYTEPYQGRVISGFGLQHKRQIYNFSCMPSIWRRTALIECLSVLDGDAWEWEMTKEQTAYDFFLNTGGKMIDVGYEDGRWMGIKRGKWVASDMFPLNEKEGLNIDFSKRGIT
jgi:hypothetical protein